MVAESGLHDWLNHLPGWAQVPVAIGLGILFLGWLIYQIVRGWQRRQRTPKPNKGPEFDGPGVERTARVLKWTYARGLSYDVSLMVEAVGDRPYEVTVRQRVPARIVYSRAAFRPNVIVTVHVDSTNPRNVWIDFKEGIYKEVYEEKPSPEAGRDVATHRFVATDSRERKEIQLCITSEGLTVDNRPGDVYSFGSAMLGVWSPELYGGETMGTALHLRCENPAPPARRPFRERLSFYEGERHSLVLGGQDHRIGSRTRLQAELKRHVDAWLPAPDFDELLTVVGRSSKLDVRRPAPGEPIRCHLIPVDPGGERPPHWALDFGNDQMWVIDPYTNARIASSWYAQVAATPATYTENGDEFQQGWTSPVLVMHVPGVQPLTIRPVTITLADRSGLRKTRFSWRGTLPRPKLPSSVKMLDGPAYGVADEDWLMLVEKFGCAPYLEDRKKQR
jgi:hypothetical protein